MRKNKKIHTSGYGLVRQFKVGFVSLIPCLAFEEIIREVCIVKEIYNHFEIHCLAQIILSTQSFPCVF